MKPANPENKTAEWKAWQNINYLGKRNGQDSKYYGNIEVFEDWKICGGDRVGNIRRYKNFLSFVGRKQNRKHVLGRIDKTQGFVPGNVRWMEAQEALRGRKPYRKFAYSRDNELIEELGRRGYDVSSLTNELPT